MKDIAGKEIKSGSLVIVAGEAGRNEREIRYGVVGSLHNNERCWVASVKRHNGTVIEGGYSYHNSERVLVVERSTVPGDILRIIDALYPPDSDDTIDEQIEELSQLVIEAGGDGSQVKTEVRLGRIENRLSEIEILLRNVTQPRNSTSDAYGM